MARLVDSKNSIALKLYPHRISDEEEPIWVSTLLQFEVKGHRRVSDSLSMTLPDIDDLIAGLEALVIEQKQAFSITTMDNDFMLSICPESRVERAFVVQFWYGEPFLLMSGYRFIVGKETIESFVQELKDERGKIKAGAKLP